MGLYRLFHAIWQSGAEHYDEADGGKGPESRLQALSAPKRAALLLTAVEAFSLEETAFIVDETPKKWKRAIVDAQHTIDGQLAARVLIIEDEPIIALDLENLVTELGHKVVAHRRHPRRSRGQGMPSVPDWCWPTSIWAKAVRASTRSTKSWRLSTFR